MVVGKGGNMARMANRVVQVAKGEADNSEDPEFKQKVSGAASELDAGKRRTMRILWDRIQISLDNPSRPDSG